MGLQVALARPTLRRTAAAVQMNLLLADVDSEMPSEELGEQVAAAAGEVSDALVSTVEETAAAYDAVSDVVTSYVEDLNVLGEATPYVAAAVLGFFVLQAAVGIAGKAFEAAKPALTAALGVLVLTLGLGASAELTKLPLIGSLLGDPVEVFFKVSALLLVVAGGAFAYVKTTEAVETVSTSVTEATGKLTGKVNEATSKLTDSVEGATSKLTGSVEGATSKLTASLPDVSLPNLPDLETPASPLAGVKDKLPKNPFRTPDEDSYVQPSRAYDDAPAAERAPRKPGFSERYKAKIEELKERDAKKKQR